MSAFIEEPSGDWSRCIECGLFFQPPQEYETHHCAADPDWRQRPAYKTFNNCRFVDEPPDGRQA